MRFFINTICIFSFLTLFAQDLEVEDRYDEFFGPRWAGHLAFRNVFFSNDYLLGGEIGVMNPSRSLTFFASFDARPYRKKILNFQGGNLFYQNTEERYFAGAGMEYHRYLRADRYGLFVQAAGNYTWGRYGGMEERPPDGWVLVPRIGAFWKLVNRVLIKAGYAYVDTKNRAVEPHRLHLAISGIFPIK